jgi:hypothetical protein
MRIAAFVFALLGIAGSAGLGMKWLGDYNDLKSKIGEISTPELDRVVRGAYSLVGCAVVALAGAILVFTRRGIIAGPLLLLSVLIPVVVAGKPAILVFTFCLVPAGILSFFVRPTPVKAVSRHRDD